VHHLRSKPGRREKARERRFAALPKKPTSWRHGERHAQTELSRRSVLKLEGRCDAGGRRKDVRKGRGKIQKGDLNSSEEGKTNEKGMERELKDLGDLPRNYTILPGLTPRGGREK